MPDTAERGNRIMAIFHFTVKIVGRSKGKSVISASAYLNGDVMKNEETGRISYYTSKKEVVYTSLMMCENAPPEGQYRAAMYAAVKSANPNWKPGQKFDTSILDNVTRESVESTLVKNGNRLVRNSIDVSV